MYTLHMYIYIYVLYIYIYTQKYTCNIMYSNYVISNYVGTGTHNWSSLVQIVWSRYGFDWHSVSIRTVFIVGLQTLLTFTRVISLPQALELFAATEPDLAAEPDLARFVNVRNQLCADIYI